MLFSPSSEFFSLITVCCFFVNIFILLFQVLALPSWSNFTSLKALMILPSVSSWHWRLLNIFSLVSVVFLALCMPNDFGLSPGHFKYYVIRLWVLFKFCEQY